MAHVFVGTVLSAIYSGYYLMLGRHILGEGFRWWQSYEGWLLFFGSAGLVLGLIVGVLSTAPLRAALRVGVPPLLVSIFLALGVLGSRHELPFPSRLEFAAIFLGIGVCPCLTVCLGRVIGNRSIKPKS